jgi:hypothetical protein
MLNNFSGNRELHKLYSNALTYNGAEINRL